DFSFTGQNQDTAAGLYDFLFREQAPVQGRWISPDPAGAAAVDITNPQTWNRYAYLANNPLNAVDPLGLYCAIDPETGGTLNGCQQGGSGSYDTTVMNGTMMMTSGGWQFGTNIAESSAVTSGTDGSVLAISDTTTVDVAGQYVEGSTTFSPSANITSINWVTSGYRLFRFGNTKVTAVCGITVKSRGIQKYNLGVIGMQHCDGEVTDSSGAVWSLSGGPQPNYHEHNSAQRMGYQPSRNT